MSRDLAVERFELCKHLAERPLRPNSNLGIEERVAKKPVAANLDCIPENSHTNIELRPRGILLTRQGRYRSKHIFEAAYNL